MLCYVMYEKKKLITKKINKKVYVTAIAARYDAVDSMTRSLGSWGVPES